MAIQAWKATDPSVTETPVGADEEGRYPVPNPGKYAFELSGDA